jgi:hypothetical protein
MEYTDQDLVNITSRLPDFSNVDEIDLDQNPEDLWQAWLYHGDLIISQGIGENIVLHMRAGSTT